MREIKFRAWNRKTKKWYFINEELSALAPEIAELRDKRGWEDIDLMQFTGLKDKNEKEIYEGDIVTWHEYGENNEVFFKNGCFQISHNDAMKDMTFRELNFSECEVIGNIYENPELIK